LYQIHFNRLLQTMTMLRMTRTVVFIYGALLCVESSVPAQMKNDSRPVFSVDQVDAAAVRPPVKAAGAAHSLSARQTHFLERENAAAAGADSLWFNPAATYYKMTVDREGLYIITPQYLEDHGVSSGGIQPETVKILNRGIEIPLYVSGEADGSFDPGDYIIFYGDFNRGDSTYYDWYSDDNAYWLSWGGAAGVRMAAADGTPSAAPQAGSFTDTIHFEEELDLFDGLSFAATTLTEFVDGERWIWRRLSPDFGLTPSIGFSITDKVPDADSILFRFGVKGYTHEYENVAGEDHHLLFRVNGLLISDVQFSGTADTVIEAAAPNNYLNNGFNPLQLESIQTPAEVDGVLFDWFEVAYPRSYTAENNRLAFYAELPGSQLIRVRNFTAGTVIAVDVTHFRYIENTSTTQEGNTFTLSFTDNYPGRTRYCAAGMDSLLVPRSFAAVQFKNLRSPDRAADYIIITHGSFLAQAQEFADYRRDRFPGGVAVVAVDDIYDEFNFGVKHPRAIRDFLTAARNWRVAPAYLLLLGDASWDPKHNDPESVNVDYVPSYGIPSSDVWYALTDGEDDLEPDLYVGRIPVTSVDDFRNVFDKIREYETGENGGWMQRFIFLNGGRTPNEQNAILYSAQVVSNNWITNPPYKRNPVFFNKTSSVAIDYSFAEDIIDEINRGALWVNASGHASGLEYDINFGGADDLDNRGKYPFMVSLSCNTGRFANPKITSLSETYLLAENRGAIAYFGTTGWGEIAADNQLLNELFVTVFRDSVHTLGEAITRAKVELYRSGGVSREDINIVEQYSLLGDPALELKILRRPDFAVNEGDIVFSHQMPSENESPLEVTVRVRNYGMTVRDSLSVRLYDVTGEAQPALIGERRLFRNGYLDSVLFVWDIQGKAGERMLKAAVNADGRIREYRDNTLNNETTAALRIFAGGAAPVFPPDLTVVDTGSVTLKAALPREKGGALQTVYFEIDTVPEFSQPLVRSPGVPEDTLFTAFTFMPPQFHAEPALFYWRVRSFNGAGFSAWDAASFYVDSASSDSLRVWRQQGRGFTACRHTGTAYRSGAMRLMRQPVVLHVESAGFNAGAFASLIVNGAVVTPAPYGADSTGQQGMYVAEIHERSGEVVSAYHFNTFSYSSHADALAAFLDTIPPGRIILAAVVDDAANRLTQPAVEGLESAGSRYVSSLQFRDSWALIGRKGAAAGSVVELPPDNNSKIVLRDTLWVYPAQGTVTSPAIPGASRWESLELFFNPPEPSQRTDYTVQGWSRISGAWETVSAGSTVRETEYIPLDGIAPARTFSKLRISAALINPERLDHPGLKRWQVTYRPAPELVLNAHLVSVDRDTLVQGDYLNARFSVYNAGGAPAESLAVRIFHLPPGGVPLPAVPDIVIESVPPDSFSVLEQRLPTSGFSGYQQLLVEVDPDNMINEVYKGNNIAAVPLYVIPDNTAPGVQFLFDRRKIQNGDFVSGHPEITIIIAENTETAVEDTAFIHLSLRSSQAETPVALAGNPDVRMEAGHVPGETVITYNPVLDADSYTLTLSVRDVQGNERAGWVRFTVESELRIEEFFPYPNPFPRGTTFTYKLSQTVDEVVIKIFTVRGRLIRTIDYAPSGSGFNTQEWDGLDEDGDRIANGAYLVKIIAKSADKSVESSIYI